MAPLSREGRLVSKILTLNISHKTDLLFGSQCGNPVSKLAVVVSISKLLKAYLLVGWLVKKKTSVKAF